MLSSYCPTETDLTLEMKIQIATSHPKYPSISETAMKCGACGVICKTEALQLFILNHSTCTTYRQMDFYFSEQVR